MSYETLTRDGLVLFLVTNIATREGKYSNNQISGDRDYVLNLTIEVVQALSGHEIDRSRGRETDMPINMPEGLLDRISSEIGRAS